MGAHAGLQRVPGSQSGVTFTNAVDPQRVAENQIRLNGSGVAAGDMDGDGLADLFFCSLGGGNRLYRNLGRWRFEDMTGRSGDIAMQGRDCTAAVFADVDGDGDLDLLVNSIGGGTRLYLNDGHGHFSLKTDSGLESRHGAMSMALADVDGDGDLDLYVANYRTTTIRSTGFSVLNVNGRRSIRPEDRERLEYLPDGRILEHGEPDILYLNDGSGHFSPSSWTEGRFLDEAGQRLTRPPLDWSLSAMFRDVDGDGAPDLYVCGDFHSPDRFWINDGHGNFRALSVLALRNTPTFSMAVDFADVNRDGADDFLTVDMLDPRHATRMNQSLGSMAEVGQYETLLRRPQLGRNTLQMNRGDSTFSERAYSAGIEATGWTWSLAFLDVDLDGYEDLLMTTGNLFDTQDQDANERIAASGPYRTDMIPKKLLMYRPLPLSKQAYRNEGGVRFVEEKGWWGEEEKGIWHGMCLVDLDNDGDLDVVVNRMNGEAGLYRNESAGGRVGVRLKGEGRNTRGIGARIELRGGAVPRQSQEMMSGGRYLSGDDGMRVFGSGKAAGGMELEVRWRGGKVSVVKGVEANRVYEIEEKGAMSESVGGRKVEKMGRLFSDESGRLGYRHYDEEFDDFVRQPLLAHKQSQGGPGLGWMDVNGDGRDDLVIGSGKGGRPGWYVNDGKGGFGLVEQEVAKRDQCGLVGWMNGMGKAEVLVGESGYEEGKGGGVKVWEGGGEVGEVMAEEGSNVSALALGDVKGEGRLELFVGKGAVGGRYPEAGASAVYAEKNGKWTKDEENSAVVAKAGLVNGAVWTDLDGDGYAELVVACEWGPVRVYWNEKGRLRERTEELGMKERIGWWRGVAAVDVDGDGRMDLVVGNWGRNTKYRVGGGHGPRMYWGDLAGQGGVELVEASYEEGMGKWVPERDLMAMGQQLPWVRAQYGTHQSYGEAGVEEILGERMKEGKEVEAKWLGSTVYMNRGRRLEAVELPEEAQYSPVSGISGGDLDGDGRMDLVLGQNFFAEPAVTSRSDAGRGLVMLGDGKGGFRALGGEESGVEVYGEQRGVAVGDYDGDGRLDVVIGENGGAARLYRNVGGRVGIRVRMKGPVGNVKGVGCVARLRVDGMATGAAQEVHGGSGWWSQDSAVLVFWRPEGKGRLEMEVGWPGGRRTVTPVGDAGKEVVVEYGKEGTP